MKVIVVLTIIFLHIFADYNMQGILATMKQRKFWEEHYPEKMYRHDYIVALITHGYAWSFIVHLPLLVMCVVGRWNVEYVVLVASSLIAHGLVHSFVDNIKANDNGLSLLQDQIIHMIQVIGISVTTINYM